MLRSGLQLSCGVCCNSDLDAAVIQCPAALLGHLKRCGKLLWWACSLSKGL